MANKPAQKASQDDWHPADIKAALEKKGWTLSALARHCGLTSGSILSHAFDRSYPASEQRIATAIGIPVQEIWPSRYHADGTKKQRGRCLRPPMKSTSFDCHNNGNHKVER